MGLSKLQFSQSSQLCQLISSCQLIQLSRETIYNIYVWKAYDKRNIIGLSKYQFSQVSYFSQFIQSSQFS